MRPVVFVGAMALVAVLGFAVGSCNDQTRFVVAEAPTPAEPQQAAGPVSAEEEAAIADLLQVAVSTDPDVPWSDRQPLIEGGDDLESTTDAVMELIASIGDVQLEVVEITGEGDEAVATVDVIVEGAAFAEGIPVALVRVDGEWKVTRDGACAVLAVGSPCPEAPT